jgi:predicted RNA-binding Zn-ribbon protein involved in translation (DUF1610 family)
MNSALKQAYKTARKEGRICSACGWMITKENWKKGYRLCPGCFSGRRGVRTRAGSYPYRDEPAEKTGNM